MRQRRVWQSLLVLLLLILTYSTFDVHAQAQPSVTGSSPSNGATGVHLDGFVAISVFVPNGGIDTFTATTSTVRLVRTSDQSSVPGNITVSGGGDAITMQPSVLLEANTSYTFSITSGLKDITGVSFLPFSMQFITGTEYANPGGSIRFEKVTLPTAQGQYFSSLVIGPDSKFYASTLTGEIWRFVMNADGTLGTPEILTSLQTANGGNRMIIGLVFDPASTAQNLIAWVSHSTFGFFEMPDWGGKITRLSGANLQNVQDYVVNLPRSSRDHLTNSLAFGPDGALYVIQGSTSAMGSPDAAWGLREERQLSAALLRVNVAAITPPLDVKTEDDGVPGSGVYDATAPGALVTVWGSGIRNAYDLVWHSNGQLYIPTNGSAAGGNTPGTPETLPASCANRVDDAINGDYTAPTVPEIVNVTQTQADLLYRVVQGGYYGHPNPKRCEWVMNGGNPTAGADPTQVNQYPIGTLPDRNWRGVAYTFGNNYSPNGVIEYKSSVFDNQLRGKLLVARYSGGDDIIVLEPGGAAASYNIINAQTGYEGLTVLQDPLDLVENPANGNLYVSEYGAQRIRLLRPILTPPTPELVLTPDRQIFSDIAGGAASATQPVTIRNEGDGLLTVNSLGLSGANAGDFVLNGVPGLPFGINPNQQITVNVAFDPDVVGVKGAALQITSNDPALPSASVNLRGLATQGLSDQNEPSLQWILDTFEIGVTVGDDNPATTPIHSTVGGTAPLLGQEVALQQFQVANSGSPVTVQALAAYAQFTDPVVQVGYYPIGSPNTRTEIFSVPGGNAQNLNPTTNGSLSFILPANTDFGIYSTWPAFGGRAAFSEDALNTWEPQTNERHKVRVYPLRSSAGVVVPNAYIMTVEAFTEGFDYNDIVFIIRNVKPSVETGIIAFENRDWVGLNALDLPGMEWVNTRLVVSHIGNLVVNGATTHGMHRDTTLRIHNQSAVAPLVISSLTINSPPKFTLLNGTVPITIPANGFYDLVVRFTETTGSKGVRTGTLTIVSNDALNPTSLIDLRGIYLPQPEGSNEPTVSQILQGFGFGTNVGSNNEFSGAWEAYGEEILSLNWQRLDPNKPIYLRQIVALHGCCTQSASVRADFVSGTDITLVHHQYWSQTIQPRTGGSGYTNPFTEFSLNRSQAFRLLVDNYTSCTAPCGQSHSLRWWPARDASGTLIPGVYIMAMDYTGVSGVTNYDYNDNMYLVANVQPSNAAVIDLAISGTDSPDPVSANNTLTYAVTAANQGTAGANNVVVTLPLPTGVEFVSASSTFAGATCGYTAPNVTCTLGTLPAQVQASVTMVVRPTIQGSVSVTAQMTTTTTGETNTANNQMVLNTTVSSSAPPPGQIIVMLDASPAGQQLFNYTATGLAPTNFSLSENGGSAFNVNVNFQNATGAVPAGYLRDSGEPYGARTGANQGSGQTYGWIEAASSTPLSITTLGRDRNLNADQRLDTLMHMQTDDISTAFSGPKVEGRWEIAVPNGAYQVTVSAGDPSIDVNTINESFNSLNVEGVNAINRYMGTGSAGSNTRHTQGTVTVLVTDGRLTIDAFGGFNTKINYVQIVGYTDRMVFSQVPVGTYAVTQAIAPNWVLMGLVCADPDNGSAIDIEALRATIDVDTGETITCTFTNVESTGQPTPTNTPTATATATATATFTATHTATATATSNGEPTATFTPTATATISSSVVPLMLINADSDQDIQPLVNGAVIDMSVSGNALTVRANPTISFFSVRFTLSSGGVGIQDRYENFGPYTMFGDGTGTGGNVDYYPWLPVPQPGSYQLMMRLYSGGNGSGSLLATEVFNFTLTNGGSNTATPTATATDTATNTATFTPSNTPTNTATFTATATPTDTATATATLTPSNTSTATATFTPSNTPTATATATPVSSVVSLMLINANTDQDIQPLANGAVVNMSVTGNALNVRANPTISVASVRFTLSLGGSTIRDAYENVAPYAMYADTNGNYNAWTPTPQPGSYQLIVRLYSGGSGSGSLLATEVFNFTLTSNGGSNTATPTPTATPTNTPTATNTPTNVPGSGQSIAQLVLINADTDQPIGLLTDGIVLDLAALGTSNLNVRADTNPAQVGSVRFSLDSTLNYKTENYLPYSIGGDSFTTINTDYYAWTPPAGTHTLTVTPFTGGGASGTAGTPMVVQFTVINGGTSGLTAVNGLVANNSFEAAVADGTLPQGWKGLNLTNGDRMACIAEGSTSAQPNAAEGRCAFSFNSGKINNQTRTLRQNFVPTDMAAGDTLTLRVAARANKLQGKVYAQVRVTYADGSTQAFRLRLKNGTYAYTGLSSSMTLREAPVRVRVALVAKQSRGRVFVDDIALTHEAGEGGGLISVPEAPDLRGQ